MDLNPILSEIQGHFAAMSPAAQGAVKMAGTSAPQPDPTMAAPGRIAPGMLLPQPDAGPPPGLIGMESQTAPLTMASPPPQLVTGPNKGQALLSNGQQPAPSEMHLAERNRLLDEGSGMDQIAHRIEGTGFGRDHPFLGKLLGGATQGLATAGDVALKVGGGGIGELADQAIPGTEGHHQVLLRQADRTVGQDEANAQKEAQTGEENAATNERNAAAEAELNPPEKPVPPAKWKPLLGGDGQVVTAPNGSIVESNEEGELRAQPLPAGATVAPKAASQGHSAFDEWSADPQKFASFQKSMGEIKAEIAQEHPTQAKNASFMNIYAAQRFLQLAYSHNPALLPVASQMIGKLLNLTPEQTATMGEIPTDQPLSPVTHTPIGTSMPGAPTPGTRTSAQNAEKFLTEYPRITAGVTSASNDLGPVSGRAVMGFLLGTVGSTGNPATDEKLSKLRTDLTFVGSNAAKFHVNSVRQAELFDKLAAAGKSAAPAIQGFLDSVRSWAQTSANQTHGHGETGGDAEPLPGTGKTFDSAAWAKANPKGDANAAKAYAQQQGYEVK